MDSDARLLAKFYRSVIDHVRSGVSVYRAVRDPASGEIVDFEWVLANAYATKKIGRPESFFVGRRILDVFPQHRTSGDFERMKRVVETGETDELTIEHNGEPLSGIFTVSATKFADGLLTAYVDVTEETHRRAEAEAVANRLAVATQAAGIGIWEIDLVAGKAFWDDATRRLYEVPEGEELAERHWRDAVHPDDLARIDAFIAAAMASGPAGPSRAFGERYRIRRPDGSLRTIQSHAQLTGKPGGEKLVGVNWDVTSEVAAAEELDIKRREAEAANVAKSQFLAVMSHEIRTPLNAMLGMAAVLEQTSLTDNQRDLLRTISESGDELLEILNGMLELSRIETGRLELEEAPLDIGALLRRATTLFAARAGEKGVRLTLERTRNVYGSLIGDPTRVRQILYNLLSNAVKFTSTGEIVVSADVTPRPSDDGRSHELTISVRDTGIGIPEDKLEAIFRPFVQADGSTTRLFGGTGLGLSIAAEFARLMGGGISVESKVDEGSTFIVRIPVSRAEVAVGAPSAPAVRTEADGIQDRRLRVLAAEDNAVNQAVLRALLGEPSASLTVVENGLEAIKAWAAGHYDLVILDMQMPVMDGPATAREIRRLETETRRERTPIIALSANAMPHHVNQCLSAGMDVHIAKPINAEEFLNAVQRLACRNSRSGEQAVA